MRLGEIANRVETIPRLRWREQATRKRNAAVHLGEVRKSPAGQETLDGWEKIHGNRRRGEAVRPWEIVRWVKKMSGRASGAGDGMGGAGPDGLARASELHGGSRSF